MDSPIPQSVEEATAAMDLSVEDAPLPEETAGVNTEDPAAGDDDMDDSTEDDKSLEFSPASDVDDDAGISPERAEILLIKATGLKEEGNNEFKEGDLVKSARAYRRGVNALKKLNKNNTGEEQVKALLVTLYTNLSTVSFKNSKYRVSVDVATQALSIEEANVKALYRRAVANRKLANLEASRSDLRAAIAVDANNIVCKKELVAVKKELETYNENQKKALAKAFGSGRSKGSFLYDDKEEASKRKEKEEQLKKLDELETIKKRKAQWEDECVKLMANNEPAISFDDWDKQRVEQGEVERRKKEKEAAARRKIDRKAAKERRAAATKDDDDDDDSDGDALTESELAMMRGYKKTADGRTTSYFTRELSEDEKNRIGDIAPKRLDETVSSTSVSLSRTDPTASSTTSSTTSAWNQAGTWEEKDTTEWCKTQLKRRLTEAGVAVGALRLVIASVEEITGDASVALVSGKKRYIFDFHVKLEYEIKRRDDDDKMDGAGDDGVLVASGVVRLPDICSTHHEELEVDTDAGWTVHPHSDLVGDATAVRSLLADQLRAMVQVFVQDFNDVY